MAEQDGDVHAALLVLLLHLPHLRHPEGQRGSLLHLHGLQERDGPYAPALAADPAMRGQVLHQAPLLRLSVERECQRRGSEDCDQHHDQQPWQADSEEKGWWFCLVADKRKWK